MTRYHLSVLVPARNEYYLDIDLLHETVVNVLANTSNKTQLIVVLDGYTDSWPKSPLPTNDRLTVIHHRQSIGQRAATNEAARVATGEYLMKLDAHCALDENFDEKLLATFEPHWTVVPAQYNLLAFNWRCNQCGNLQDQGSQPNRCSQCRGRKWTQQKLWIPRDGREGSDGKGGKRNSLTHSWRFDTNLDFQYFGAYAADEKHCKKHKVVFRPEAQTPIHDTMSLLGACWAMTRKRYFEIEPCDESFGSWGDMGTELSCKTWLSGGEMKCNTNTWFAHFFRVGGLGFPYPDGGRKERAKARGKALWLTNSWPKQVYPLSWLIEKFRPLPDWHVDGNSVLAQVNAAGEKFRPLVVSGVPSFSADAALSHVSSIRQGSAIVEQVSSDTVGLSLVDDSGAISSASVDGERNKIKMERIAAPSVSTKMIQGGNIAAATPRDWFDSPGIDNTMGQVFVASIANASVSSGIQPSDPVPAAAGNNLNLGKDSNKILGVQSDSEILLGSHDSVSETGLRSGPEPRIQRDSGPMIVTQKRAGCLYYTCNSHDETLELACRNNLKQATNGHEIGCVARERTDFGDWSIIIDQPKGPLTMHQQILVGLERSTADYVFFCENDVLYHPSHFEFVPPRVDVFYYNVNVWRVRYEDGFAIRTSDCKQLSGLVANRSLLLNHYRARVERITKEGFSRRNGYEPGTRKIRHGGYDDIEAQSWSSTYPNLDIKDHGQTVTKGQWTPDDFRNKKYTEGWQETDLQIEGWPVIYGRLKEYLKELADGSI